MSIPTRGCSPTQLLAGRNDGKAPTTPWPQPSPSPGNPQTLLSSFTPPEEPPAPNCEPNKPSHPNLFWICTAKHPQHFLPGLPSPSFPCPAAPPALSPWGCAYRGCTAGRCTGPQPAPGCVPALLEAGFAGSCSRATATELNCCARGGHGEDKPCPSSKQTARRARGRQLARGNAHPRP